MALGYKGLKLVAKRLFRRVDGKSESGFSDFVHAVFGVMQGRDRYYSEWACRWYI